MSSSTVERASSTPDMGDQPLRLCCERLAVRRGSRRALSEVTLTILADECVCIAGPNGAGKTTLLLALAGLLPLAAGTVRLGGREIHRWQARARAQLLAYVPQVIEGCPPLRVRDVVTGGRYAYIRSLGQLSKADERAVQSALARCGLVELADRRFDAISGGERRKALLAAAIAQDARMLLLDEPNTALDPAYQLELLGILREWHAGGRGLLVVSHDLQLPAALGGRVIALREGCVVADGLAERILTPEVLGATYGDVFGEAVTPEGRRLVLPAWWRVG